MPITDPLVKDICYAAPRLIRATIANEEAIAISAGCPTKYINTGTFRMEPPDPKTPRLNPISAAPNKI
ncbi:MAG: hypothetical protein NWQ42_11530, partial [Alishewanella sp.]|nr:hypothetical protein [Alishewanella sp.]